MTGLVGKFQHGQKQKLKTRTLIILSIIIIVSAWTLLSSIDLLDFTTHFDNVSSSDSLNNNDNQLQEHTDVHDSNNNVSLANLGPLTPAESLLDPNTKYVSFLPFAGLTNQFMGLEFGALLAKKLNRTLILPPIISNNHDDENTHQHWSRYFDLPRFTHLTGIPVLEWDHVRPLTPAQRAVGRDQALRRTPNGTIETKEWVQVAENLTCEMISGYGGLEKGVNHSARNFLWHFLFRAIYVQKPPPPPGTPDFTQANVTGGAYLNNGMDVLDDIVARYIDSESQLLVLSNTYKIQDPPYGNRRQWSEIGANLHFVPQLMEYVTMCVNEELRRDRGIETLLNDDPEEKEVPVDDKDALPQIPKSKNPNATDSGDIDNPETSKITAPVVRIPHIAVHLRRGDIGLKCSADKERCLVPFDRIVEAVALARTAAAARGLHSRLPVVVTTDTTSEDDIQRIQQLGWHRMDHSKYGTEKLWGSFGAVLVDSAILAHADEFVGTAVSTLSKIAAARQSSWYHRKAIYP
ncbi:hypothetical protein BGZ49_007607 [Haplosporangium sp. Z 27]|nr:hypothetical protein BGZ49_007607 [Haplosporangium sp. Z 27]